MTTRNSKEETFSPENLDDILNTSARGTLSEEKLDQLRKSATRIQEFPELELEVLTYQGPGYAGNNHLEVYVNTENLAYAMPAKKVCICSDSRSPLECCCHTSSCTNCGSELIAVNRECDFDNSCLDDACPMCSHFREDCNRQDFLDRMKSHARRAMGQPETAEQGQTTPTTTTPTTTRPTSSGPGYTAGKRTADNQAEAYLSAVQEFFGYTMPRFPLIESMLDEVASPSIKPEERKRYGGNPTTWVFEDDSTIRETKNRLYLQ